jgi:hypothetical protein
MSALSPAAANPTGSPSQRAAQSAAHGQGSDGFGAKWWLVAPTGTDVTASVSSFTAAASGGASAAPAWSAPSSAPASSSAGGGWS